jgi:hypothetical protein
MYPSTEVNDMCFGRLFSLDPGRHDGEGTYQGPAERNTTYFAVDEMMQGVGGGDDSNPDSDSDVDGSDQ